MLKGASMRKVLLAVVMTGLAVVLSAGPVKADGIDFLGSGGGMTFVPSVGNTFSVSGAGVSTVNRLISPWALHPITSGLLNLTSGAATCVYNSDPSCAANGATFGPGGTLSLTGGIFGLPAGTSLVQGSFVSAQFTNLNGFGFFGGLLQITSMNSTLLANLFPDLGSLPRIGPGTVVQVYGNWDPTTGSGSIGSTNFLIAVQEPASLVVMGSAFVVMALLFRRKLSTSRR